MRGTVAKALRRKAVADEWAKVPADKVPNPEKLKVQIDKAYRAGKKSYKTIHSDPNTPVKPPNRRQVRLAMRVADALLATKKPE